MTSPIWERDINVEPLAAELDVAVRDFNVCAQRVTAAQTFFLARHDSLLDEPPPAGSGDVDARQMRVRCSNQSGRLAMFVAFNQLVRARKVVAKQVGKIVATLAHIANFNDRNFLGSRSLSAATDCERAFAVATSLYDRHNDCKPTVEKGPAALKASFAQLVKDGINSQVPESHRPDEINMFLIPLANAEIDDGQLMGANVNEELVVLGNSALAYLDSQAYKEGRSQYLAAKDKLDEPTSARRLLAAIASEPNAARVQKLQQSSARVAFLARRSEVSRSIEQISTLADRLAKLVGQLSDCVNRNGKNVPTLKMVAKNNVLTADAIVHGLRLIVNQWTTELLTTTDLAQTAEGSLVDELANVCATQPFDQLRWVFGIDGRYIDLSRHAKR